MVQLNYHGNQLVLNPNMVALTKPCGCLYMAMPIAVFDNSWDSDPSLKGYVESGQLLVQHCYESCTPLVWPMECEEHRSKT